MKLRFNELLNELAYPLSSEQLVSAIGSREVEYPTGKVESLETVCRRIEIDEYTSQDEVELILLSALHGDAVGRQGYSDRDPPIPEIDRYDPISY